MSRYALVLEYDGGGYAGFQFQAGRDTVQERLQSALSTYLREHITIHCAGRTDAGVHATGQVISFDSQHEDLSQDRRFLKSVNAILPADIAVHSVDAVPADFHARFSCIARSYEYFIWNDPIKPALGKDRAVWIRSPIFDDTMIERTNAECRELLGSQDFAAFTRAEYRDEVTIRYLDTLRLDRLHDPASDRASLLRLSIRGNAFLHNMIRILAGTIVDRAQNKITAPLVEILHGRERTAAGRTAPPGGLYFRAAFYDPADVGDARSLRTLEKYPRFRT